MKNDMEYKLLMSGSSKRKLIITALTAIVMMAIVLCIFRGGYIRAAKRYKDTIRELEEEVDRLSEPVAVYEEASKEVDIRVINAKIQNIGELATVEYLYTDAGKFEDPAEVFGRIIPFSFTTTSFIAKWDGSIKAGIDISQVTAEVNKEAKLIIVYIPKAEILSHEIKDESIETLDEKNGLFNKIRVEDIRNFDMISKEAMEQRAIENGILDMAYHNAKEIIYRLINTGVVEEEGYTVTFKVSEE